MAARQSITSNIYLALKHVLQKNARGADKEIFSVRPLILSDSCNKFFPVRKMYVNVHELAQETLGLKAIFFRILDLA